MGCMQIFIGLCFVAMASATGTPFDCYQCERASSDQLCNLAGSQPCADGDACYIYYHRHYSVVEITKKCINGADCIRPEDYLCNYDYTRCSFCCKNSTGCNYHTPTRPTTDAPVKGDRGPRGPIGNDGEPGPDGPGGPKGPPGPPGWNGEEGFKGNKGAKGQDGKRGHPGDAGPFGPKGNRGEDGPPGPTGPIGTEGPKGEGGDPGPDGHPGIQGDRGNSGLQGPEGVTGPKGFRGHAGPGIKGSKGAKGDKGLDGPPGTGIKGCKGECGVPGDLGAAGWPGEDGPDVECECEPEPIVYFTVFTEHTAASRVTGETFVVQFQVTVTNVNELAPDGGLLGPDMDFEAPVDGVYVFQVTAVSICTLAWNIGIVNGNGFDAVDSVLVYTGRDINDALNEFPVGTAHVAYCMDAGTHISVAALPQAPPLPSYYYPTPHPTDVYFSGCLIGQLTGGAVCPAQFAGDAPPEAFGP